MLKQNETKQIEIINDTIHDFFFLFVVVFIYIHSSPLSSGSRVLNLKCEHGDFTSLKPLSIEFRSI